MEIAMRDALKPFSLHVYLDPETGGYMLLNLPLSKYRDIAKIVGKYGYRLDISGKNPIIKKGG
jgi:hypothetical protein